MVVDARREVDGGGGYGGAVAMVDVAVAMETSAVVGGYGGCRVDGGASYGGAV